MTDNKNIFIHSSSFIDFTCNIGSGTKIWHFCHISQNAEIGENCNLGQNVYIGINVKIGNKVKIQNNVSVYTGVTLEDEVFCGPSVVFTNILTPRSGFPRNKESDFKQTLVKKGASLGANSTIICGVIIGSYSMIGAGSVVTKDIPDFALAYGNPARVKGWVCTCGIKLNKTGNLLKCPECGNNYIKTETGLKSDNTAD